MFKMPIQGLNLWLSISKVCMCSSDLCNANDYNIHVERGNQLFAEILTPASPNLVGPKAPSSNRTLPPPIDVLDGSSSFGPSMKSVVGLSSSSDPFVQRLESKILREGEEEREELIWLDPEVLVDDDSRRTPRQIRPQGKAVLCIFYAIKFTL